MATSSLRLGDHVVVHRQGVGILRELPAPGKARYVVELPSGTVGIPEDAGAELIRPPVPRAEAEKLLARLCDREGGERTSGRLSSVRMLGKMPIAEQVESFRELYTDPQAFSADERAILSSGDGPLYAELAHVLGVPETRLREQAKRGDVAPTSVRPPAAVAKTSAAPKLRGYELLASFSVGGAVAVGAPSLLGVAQEATKSESARASYVAAAQHGTWHAYVKRSGSRAVSLLAVHAEVADPIEQRKTATVLARVRVAKGRLAMVDAAAREEAKDLASKLGDKAPEGSLDGRGCLVHAEGARAVTVKGGPARGELAFVTIELGAV